MKSIIHALLLTLLFTLSASAHPVSLSSTIADIHADRIDVDIEVMLEDLVLYHSLAADDQNRYSAIDLKQAVEKHRKFLLDYFSILDGEGQALTGQVLEVATDQIDANKIGQTELMRRTINFKLRYALEKQPKFLTFLQSFGGPKASLPAVMDLHILRDGSFGEPGTQLTHGRPHTVKLEWNNLASGKRLSLAELRQQRRAQLEERLGIATYTGMYSFIYVNRFEVRHEVLVPLLTLDQWVTINRQDSDYIEVDEQQAAVTAIEKFISEKTQVVINGMPVVGKLVKTSFFALDINDFALGGEPRRISTVQARVGLIISYPAVATPRDVSLRWSAYSEFAPTLSSVVLVGDTQPAQHQFDSLEDTWKWTGDLDQIDIQPLPANQTISPDEAGQRAMERLLTNVYLAFQLREDEQVYDALAKSVTGPLLRDVYLRIKRSLVMAEQGGTIASIQSVTVNQLDAQTSNDSHSFLVAWHASGTSEHWGHLHKRTSQYRARISIVNENGDWKLSKFQLLDEKRLKFETSIRGYDSNP